MQEIGTIAYEHGKAVTITAEQVPSLLVSGPVRIGSDLNIKGHDYNRRIYSKDGKSPCLASEGGGNTEPKVAMDKFLYRKLTVTECERLQTVPDFYTSCVSNSQGYKMLGNGWTVDVIAHIFGFLKEGA